MITSRNARVLCCSLVALTAACSGSPRPAKGSYILTKVNQKDLPAQLNVVEACRLVLKQASMDILSRKTYASSFTIDRECLDGTTTDPDPGTRGTFSVDADTLYFVTAAGASGGSGTFSGDTITVTGPRHTLTYIRKPAE